MTEPFPIRAEPYSDDEWDRIRRDPHARFEPLCAYVTVDTLRRRLADAERERDEVVSEARTIIVDLMTFACEAAHLANGDGAEYDTEGEMEDASAWLTKHAPVSEGGEDADA